MDSVSQSRPLEIFFLPYLSPGHIIPLFEMARLFAARGEHVTIITTPSNNSLLLDKFIAKDAAAGLRIGVHTVAFPSKQVGLPDGLENFFSVTDLETAAKLYKGLTLMQTQIEEFVITRRPDCLVADMFYPWATDLATRVGIPRLVFQATCIFAVSMKDAVRREDSQHRLVTSDYEPFVVPNLPHPITITRAQLPDYVRTPNGYTQLMEQWREAELKSYGVLVNNFEELEPEYTEHYKKIMGHTVWHIGPAALLVHRKAEEKVKRSHETVVGEAECVSWLDSNQPNSVLYICFGSACRFPDDQLLELACGLEASGHRFVWVVFGKEEEKEEDERKWLPEGYEERMKKENRGMIVRGWAPQMLILDHPATGGFMTHCGWNSTLEGICAGIPMITWPLYAEQFYNEKLITQVLGIGVDVGVEDWNLWVHAGKKVVRRESIEMAVKKLMDGGEEAVERRSRAREKGEAAKKAVTEGGSSHNHLTLLIEELKKMRNQK